MILPKDRVKKFSARSLDLKGGKSGHSIYYKYLSYLL